MEARNYAPNAQHNMILPVDAQIVSGVVGNGVYLPAGCGTLEMSGALDAMGVSLWRTWDGVSETDGVRALFSFKNFAASFDAVSGKLRLTLPGGNTVHTDIADDTELTHWVFNFIKNGTISIYKNAVKIYETQTAEEAVDLSGGFILGGGITHATFDEVYVHSELLKEQEVRGLYYLISSGMPAEQIQEIAQSAQAKYLGVTETVSDNRSVLIVKGEQLGIVYANAGDWVLMSKTVGGRKAGVCYRWTGLMWINLEPEYNYEAQYQACLSHICEIPELTQDTGHYGALFAKMLVTQKALIDSLVVKQLKIDADLSTDNNFEAYFDERHGLEITNKRKTILRVPPQGDAVFTGKVNVGAVQLLDSGVFIKDGEIAIENNGWKGCLRPCAEGVEFAIMSQGEDGAMTKQQMRTVIRNGVLSLFVLGSISCENIYKNNSAGKMWTQRGVVDFVLTSVAYGNNKWIAIAHTWVSDGAYYNNIICTSLDRITWTPVFSFQSGDVRSFSIAYGNNMWVASGDSSCVYTSSDGITWTKRNLPEGDFVYTIAYGNNMWVAGGNSSCVYTSSDGITWMKRNLPEVKHVVSVAYGNNKWVAIACFSNGVDSIIYTSSDGITWTSVFSFRGLTFKGLMYNKCCIAYGNNMWVAGGGNFLYTSSDGITWTKRNSSPLDYTPTCSITYGNNMWVCAAGYDISTSSDGITWTKRYFAPEHFQYPIGYFCGSIVTYENGRWVVSLGYNPGANGMFSLILHSADQAVTWTTQ